MAKRTVDIVVKAHDRASRKFKTLGGSVHRLNRHFATLRRVAVAALAGLGTGAVFRSLIKAASDAEEIGSKFAVVFREQAAAADQFAKQLAKSVGRSRVEIRGFLSSMQDLFVPLGFARGDAREMSQGEKDEASQYNEIMVMDNFGDYELIKIPYGRGGHGGGDTRLQNQVFKDPDMPDPLKHAAGSRDGAMSILIGIAARKSIEEQRHVRISELTSLKPQVKRPVS